MNRKQRLQASGAVIGLIVAVMILSLFIGSVDWSRVWHWTWITAVVLALLALISWIAWDEDRRTKAGTVITHKWFKKFAGWTIFALFIFFIAWPWAGEKYEKTEVAQAQAQAEYLRTHPQFPSDTIFWFTARSNTFGKSWTLPREVWKGYTMEVNAEELDVPYVVATQAGKFTIRPEMKTVQFGMVRTIAFKSLGDSTLRIGVRFYK